MGIKQKNGRLKQSMYIYGKSFGVLKMDRIRDEVIKERMNRQYALKYKVNIKQLL